MTSLDSAARANLRKTVAKARNLVETDYQNQLKRLGIQEDGTTIPAGRLVNLTLDQKRIRDQILQAIQKEQLGHLTAKESYERYVRHAGFTIINRIAALRAMEVRNLLKYETIIRRTAYAGRSQREYVIAERDAVTEPADLARASFREACEEVSTEIKVLFDLSDEYSLLFPSPHVFNELHDLLGKQVPERDWQEDEIIGWTYQYYNSAARDEFRKRRRPPHPDDVPVINQFYTSSWIVRALVDNTLGRLWLEMQGRLPKAGHENSRQDSATQSEETVDSFCRYLVYAPEPALSRKKKRARDIRVLDPACGSGHFLTYAFDVLYRIYREDEPETPPEQIPNLILEHNLYGIDIDLRAVQLAALSLYLKAKRHRRDLGISRMNLVCADARITDGNLQKRFLKDLEPDTGLQRVFAKLFQELVYTYHVGSLLRVREPFQKLLQERAKGVQTHFHPSLVGQTSLSRRGKLGGQAALSPADKEAILVRPSATLEDLLKALHEYERRAIESKDMGSLLFASETEKSAGLLSLLIQQYDVVLMNPPYGDAPEEAKAYLAENYPRTRRDYYAAFIEQAIDLCLPDGFVGTLTGRTFMFLKWFEQVRTELLLRDARPELLLDLNTNPADAILDEATGRWAATVIRTHQDDATYQGCLFFRLTTIRGEQAKIAAFENALSAWNMHGKHPVVYPTSLESLKRLPGMPYSYWVPESLAELFARYPPLDRDNAGRPDQPKIADLKQGLATADDMRFVRYWWEVDPDSIALTREETLQGKKWVPFAKGGTAYYSDMLHVVNWANDGCELKEFAKTTGNPRIQNEEYYFREALCWPLIARSAVLDFHSRQRGCVFSHAAHSLFVQNRRSCNLLLATLNSSLLAFCYLALDPTLHNRSLGYVCQLPIALSELEKTDVGAFAREIFSIKRNWEEGNEISTQFVKPWLLLLSKGMRDAKPSDQHPSSPISIKRDGTGTQMMTSIPRSASLQDLARRSRAYEESLNKRISECQTAIDAKVCDAYGVKKEDREFVEQELATISGSAEALRRGRAQGVQPTASVEEHILRLLSYYANKILQKDTDGIAILPDLLRSIRAELASDFGEGSVGMLETEIASILGKGLEEWLAADLAPFHVGLYERRPIVWQLTSANFSARKASNGLFSCFICYNKIDKDTPHKIRTKYLKAQLDALRWREERLLREATEKPSISKGELTKVRDSLEELERFDEALRLLAGPREQSAKLSAKPSWVEQKVFEICENGWNPIRDYGVLVNIRPLLEAGVLHEAFRRVR